MLGDSRAADLCRKRKAGEAPHRGRHQLLGQRVEDGGEAGGGVGDGKLVAEGWVDDEGQAGLARVCMRRGVGQGLQGEASGERTSDFQSCYRLHTAGACSLECQPAGSGWQAFSSAQHTAAHL